MATIRKTLVALNENIVFNIPTDKGAVVGVEYGAGGLGTIELQGRMHDLGAWFTIQLLKPDGTAAALNLAAPGVGYADVSYCEFVRVNKTVAGAGGVDVDFTMNTKAA